VSLVRLVRALVLAADLLAGVLAVLGAPVPGWWAGVMLLGNACALYGTS
jgi:hypothetical protein